MSKRKEERDEIERAMALVGVTVTTQSEVMRRKMTVVSQGEVTVEERSFLEDLDSELSPTDGTQPDDDEPQGFKLFDEQQVACDAIIDFVAGDSEDSIVVLTGFAGTGKTTTLREIIYGLQPHVRGRTVWVTAPTHKATNVAKRVFEAHIDTRPRPDLEFATLHSTLALRPKQVQDQSFLVQRTDRIRIEDGDVLIVDEASMVDTKNKPADIKAERLGLFEYIQDVIETRGVKVIFVGDPAQLPPINAEKSPALEAGAVYKLTTVRRQRSDNPVLGLCTDVRRNWESGHWVLPPIEPLQNKDGDGVYVGREIWNELLPRAFKLGGGFDTDPDMFRCVAWTNDAVDALCAEIQELRYGKLTTPFAEGERVMCKGPVKAAARAGFGLEGDPDEDEIIYRTQTEGLVEGMELAEHREHEGLMVWAVKVVMDGDRKDTLYVLHKDAELDYEKRLASLKRQAIAAKRESNPKVKPNVLWAQRFRLMEAVAKIKCAYGGTAHTLQGTTVQNMFVDLTNIMENPRPQEALQCAYVGLSRASHNLIIR